ncbi:hypothetical protein H8356DRAFT_1424896 [Neocallimastix lanati (nom. inval.)]|nr:hypothetical protein H8356DRAFT_1424896 [Neocallimastix sp. JGI-2020a]
MVYISRTIPLNLHIASVIQADSDGDEMNIFWLPEKLNIINNIRSFKNFNVSKRRNSSWCGTDGNNQTQLLDAIVNEWIWNESIFVNYI